MVDDDELIGSDADAVVSCLIFCQDERDQKIYFLHVVNIYSSFDEIKYFL